MKKIKFLFIALLFTGLVSAQDGPDLPPDDEEVPIGQDIAVLVAIGGLYFTKNLIKIKSFKKPSLA